MPQLMKPKIARSTPNKSPRSVRRHSQRVAQSRAALRRAMAELLRERAFDTITVSDLLRRSGIGRATFYAHFQDKHDLLLASFCGMLDAITAAMQADTGSPSRLLPVREFFAHVGSAGPMLQMLQDAGQLPVMWELAGAHFARVAEPAAGSPVAARFLAGAMLELLRWWLMAVPQPSPEAMDAQFHELARRMLPARRPSPR